MNRTIKFRGKSIYDEEWLYGSLVKIEKDRYAVIPPLNDIEIGKSIGMYEVCLETIGQFTSLLDKNGKKSTKVISCWWATMDMKIYTIK